MNGKDVVHKIRLNGKEVLTSKPVLTYDDIMTLAWKNPSILYTITYINAAGAKSEGSVCPGESVSVKDGTRIDIGYTGNA